ncbi:DUF4268 domain-containing protein [Salinibacter ruber]|uniref:DUF4268 domain-containing protein n=1 Tax=Salinibacter ruber TaxID=146919 RepID=A0A9X2TGK3_9BACT|nr:DUF4268 domain-containing protein [Salinibacter ruber]MCS3662012.1 hypothetical protein [Salinibacter ruber]MCS3711807.1 hypothetical protein [Salinibacter ruber]MCS4142650.1 hypothetical protein [Salinibacter ruber]
MPDLGRLEKIDVRSEWADEARDFTPWLAEENLDLLEDTIGIDLELEATEKPVGPFNADILCKDTVEDQWVLIENQLKRTDHKHLGQLLTYASGLGAVTIVWVSDRFNDQHRSALDWLNDITDEGINFFGLEIELWQIEDSPPAPKFNVVSKPNDWSNRVSDAAEDEELTEFDEAQLDFWTEFAEYLNENNSTISPRKPQSQHWMYFAVGDSRAHLSARVNTQDELIGVDLALKEKAEPLFHLLKREKEQIEAEVGLELNWNRQPDKTWCIIRHWWEQENPLRRRNWPGEFQLLSDALTSFYDTFSPRLSNLDADDWSPPSSENTRTNSEEELAERERR